MNIEIIHEVLEQTHAGQLIFPEVVRRLLETGIESYFCDFATDTVTLYAAEGGTHTTAIALPHSPVAAEFSSSGIVAAIRGAQADTIRYPEFVRQSTLAGVIAYWAFLTGRQVLYLGRKGEQHIEPFPTRPA